MAQPKPDRISIDQVLKLVEQLSPDEQGQLRLALDKKARSQEWRDLVTTVAEENKGLLPLSDDEIMAEVKAVKAARKARSAEDSD